MRAIVAFNNKGVHWADRFLHPDYKHCFCSVLVGDYWIMIDSTNEGPEIEVIAPKDFDLAKFYVDEGCSVISLDFDRKSVVYPIMLSNCVGAVKAVLSIRKPLVFTPYQLWRHLS